MSESLLKLNKSRVQLLAIIGLFAIPVILANYIFDYMGSHGVSETVNHGELISPAKPLQAVSLIDAQQQPLPDKLLLGKWTYVIFANGSCDKTCEDQLYVTRQTRVGINKDMQRLQRLLVINYQPDATWLEDLNKTHPELVISVLPDKNWTAFYNQFKADIDMIGGSPFFLVDPLGNLMMGYGDSAKPRGIMSDIKKLMKINITG